jgi:alpha-tubulin suppressor-like RCC1 family protein
LKEIDSKASFESILDNVKLVSASRNSIVLVNNENEIFFMGKSKDNHFKKESIDEKKLCKDNEFTGHSITSISSGNNYTVLVAEDTLFGAGDKIFIELG